MLVAFGQHYSTTIKYHVKYVCMKEKVSCDKRESNIDLKSHVMQFFFHIEYAEWNESKSKVNKRKY